MLFLSCLCKHLFIWKYNFTTRLNVKTTKQCQLEQFPFLSGFLSAGPSNIHANGGDRTESNTGCYVTMHLAQHRRQTVQNTRQRLNDKRGEFLFCTFYLIICYGHGDYRQIKKQKQTNKPVFVWLWKINWSVASGLTWRENI